MFSRDSSKDPLFSITDIFGYLLTFFIVWFIWTTYKAAPGQTTQKTNVSAVAKVRPLVTTTKQTESVISEELPIEEAHEIIEPSLWESMYTSTVQFFSSVTKSPDETLHTINSSINNVITSVGSDTPQKRTLKNNDERDKSKNRSRKKDTLSSF